MEGIAVPLLATRGGGRGVFLRQVPWCLEKEMGEWSNKR